MPLRKRAGKWHYRFEVHGHEFTGSTWLAATERNKTAAMRKEAAARELVLAGKSNELKISVIRFSDAAAQFIDWCSGEYRAHPASAKRISTSFASIAAYFGRQTVSSVTAGEIEGYKTFRRSVSQVREVTLRHDLHSLSLFFQFAVRHNWCRGNPVKEVEIPSDKDAVRIHVLTPAEETAYFEAVKQLAAGANVQQGVGREGNLKLAAESYQSLHDAMRLILLQGVRPAEVMAARVEHVDGDHWLIPSGKSAAARRTLRLTAESRAILEGRKLVARNGWLWPGRTSGHVTTLQKTHDAAVERSGVLCVIYDFRHTFATRAAAAGMPITTLAAVLGHGNLRSVMKYVHVRQADIDAGMMMLEPKAAEKEEAQAAQVQQQATEQPPAQSQQEQAATENAEATTDQLMQAAKDSDKLEESTQPDDPIMVDGLRVSPVTIKMDNTLKSMWEVQSAENAEREKRGERQIGGNSLHGTKEQAIAAAKSQAQDAKDNALAEAEQAQQEKIARDAAAAKKADTINGFTVGMAPNTAALATKALGKLMRFREKVASVREHIEAWHKAGELEVSTTQEPRIKPMSRMAYHRADQQQQDAHEKRMKEAGNKTVYWVNDIDLGKTAFDYARHLLNEDDQAGTGVETAQQQEAVKNEKPAAARDSAESNTETAAAVNQPSRPDKWRGDMVQARIVAGRLGLKIAKNASPADIVKAIDAHDAKAAGKAQEAAPAAKKELPLTVGTMPNNAEAVTVKDGVVFIGKYEALDYDSGEPITVPKGSSREAVAKALKDAGALVGKMRIFGLGEQAGDVMYSRSANTKAAYEARIAPLEEQIERARRVLADARAKGKQSAKKNKQRAGRIIADAEAKLTDDARKFLEQNPSVTSINELDTLISVNGNYLTNNISQWIYKIRKSITNPVVVGLGVDDNSTWDFVLRQIITNDKEGINAAKTITLAECGQNEDSSFFVRTKDGESTYQGEYLWAVVRDYFDGQKL